MDSTCKFSVYRVDIAKVSTNPNKHRGERVADFVKFEDAIEYGQEYIDGDFHTFIIIERS